MIDYTKILTLFFAGSEWTLDGDEYAGLTWLSDTPKPTKKELDNLWPQVESKVAADEAAKQAAKQAVLNKLGLTEDELRAALA